MSDAVPKTPEEETKVEAVQDPPKETEVKENFERRQQKNKDGQNTADNEIRVQAKGQIKNYLGYAFRILNKTDYRSLKISATGNAIVKALILIELVKRRVGNLYQINHIDSDVIDSVVEVENMPAVANKRRVTKMDTTLSKDPLDETDVGYQPPVPKDQNENHQPNTQKFNKKNERKTYNPDMKDKKDDGDKRRDRDNQKHNDNQDNNNKRDDREATRGKPRDKRQKYKQLRTIINDDEFTPNQPRQPLRGNRGARGTRGRGIRGGRGEHREEGRDFFNGPPRDYDRDYPPQNRKRYDNRDNQDRADRGRWAPRSNDDFYVRPRGRGGRDPMDMHHGPPRYDYGPGYRYGPPQGRGGRYHDEYYDEHYGQQANMYGPPRQFNGPPPLRGRPQTHGDQREQGRMPPHDPRYDYDPRRGGPRSGPYQPRDQERGGHERGGHVERGGHERGGHVERGGHHERGSHHERGGYERGGHMERGGHHERGSYHPRGGYERGGYQARGGRGGHDTQTDGQNTRETRPYDTPDEYRPQRGAIRGRGRGRGRGNYNNAPDMDGDRNEDHRGEPNVRRRARGGAPEEQ